MLEESKIALNCPYCNESIYETLNWFKQTYSTCPECDKGLSADQFAAVIHDLEQAFDLKIEELVTEKPQGGGCCGSKKKSSCCGSH